LFVVPANEPAVIFNLILRSGLFLGRVSKDGRESVPVRPSFETLARAALCADRCKLLRMRAEQQKGPGRNRGPI
jgi:hypothetical protein